MEHSLPWRPKFVYGVGVDIVTWQPRLPAGMWQPETPTVGGSRTAASGVPAAYVVRRDYNLELPLRVYENELPDLDALIIWGQLSETIQFYPDRNAATYYTVYLEAPLAGDLWRPTRMRSYPKVFELPILLRLATAGPWDLDFFPCVTE